MVLSRNRRRDKEDKRAFIDPLSLSLLESEYSPEQSSISTIIQLSGNCPDCPAAIRKTYQCPLLNTPLSLSLALPSTFSSKCLRRPFVFLLRNSSWSCKIPAEAPGMSSRARRSAYVCIEGVGIAGPRYIQLAAATG